MDAGGADDSRHPEKRKKAEEEEEGDDQHPVEGKEGSADQGGIEDATGGGTDDSSIDDEEGQVDTNDFDGFNFLGIRFWDGPSDLGKWQGKKREPSWRDWMPHDHGYGYEEAMRASDDKGNMDHIDELSSLLTFEPTDASEGERETTYWGEGAYVPCCWKKLLPHYPYTLLLDLVKDLDDEEDHPDESDSDEDLPPPRPREREEDMTVHTRPGTVITDGNLAAKKITNLKRVIVVTWHFYGVAVERSLKMYKCLDRQRKIPDDIKLKFARVISGLKEKPSFFERDPDGDVNFQYNLEFSFLYPAVDRLYICLMLHRYRETGRLSSFCEDFRSPYNMCHEEDDENFVELYDSLLKKAQTGSKSLLTKAGRLAIMHEMREHAKPFLKEQKLSCQDILKALIFAKRYMWSRELATERYRIKRYLCHHYAEGEDKKQLLKKLSLVEEELTVKWETPIPYLLGVSKSLPRRMWKNPTETKTRIFREYQLTLATIDSLPQVSYVQHIKRKMELAKELGIWKKTIEQLFNELWRKGALQKLGLGPPSDESERSHAGKKRPSRHRRHRQGSLLV